jgi:chromosomal replication initiator protein
VAENSSLDKIWPSVLASIEKRVSPKNFNSWFKPLRFLEHDGGTVYLGVPDHFTRDWIKDHGLKDILQEEFSALAPKDVRVVIRIVDIQDSEFPADPSPPVPVPSEPVLSASLIKTSQDARRDAGLNTRYLFDQFVVGPSNQLAYAASMSVAENPGTTYNPLFIYGGAGLGKTHLLTAIGHHILKTKPTTRIIYASTETFVNEFITAIRFMKMDEFHQRYRKNCDVLLIDDIQFITNKTRTQEEFFHTFNTLYDSRRQIVITSDSYPQEIPELEERLRTRFQWGLIADIQPPDIETRVAIIQKKAENEHLDIPDDVSMFIASSVKSNIREIEGSLKRLGAFSSMYGKSITLDFAQEVLKDTLGRVSPLSIEDVQKTVCSFFNVKISDIKGSRRHRSISKPRQIAMYFCRSYLNATYPEIGLNFNKDHSTAIASIRHIEKLIKSDPSTREAIEAIKRQLGI